MRKMNVIVMTLAGLLLIVASVLKFHEMLFTCVPSWDVKAALWLQEAQKVGEAMPLWKANLLGFWESYEFFLIQIPLEFALGVWMVSGLFRKAAWLVGTLAYFGFIFATLSKILTGAESCGCFGQVHVDPWITLFAIDIPFFLLLALFWPRGGKLLPPPWPTVGYLLAVAAPTIILMVLAAPAMVTFRPECLKPQDQQPDASAQLKLEIYQLKQQLQRQTEQTYELQQQYQVQLQTLQEKEEQIRTLAREVQQLRRAAAERAVEPAEPNEPEPDQANSTEAPDEPQQAEPAEPQPVESTPPTQQTEPTPAENQWEWLQYVVEDDVRQQLSRGLVAVLMYHHDCSDCAVMVPKYDAYYNEMLQQDNDAFKIAFLAIPPYGEGPVPEDTQAIHGKLTDQRLWELTSPYVVVLLDGEVMKTWPQGTAPEPENILDEAFGQ